MTDAEAAGPATDPVMTRIGEALALSQQGRRGEARAAFAALWDELGPEADPLHRCTLAHHMADVQDDPADELAWDERALVAAESITDERAERAGATGPVAAFYPSLHLNLGEDHRKLGDLDTARHHLELGRAAADALADDGYGQMIKGGLASLADRLAERRASDDTD